MDRPVKFLLAALVAAAPVPALAQAWPATVVAAGPRLAQTATVNPLVRIEHDGRLTRRAIDLPPTQPAARLKLSTVDIDDVPEVEIRPKAEWFDDQGLRVSPTRVAFKRRF